MPDGLAAPDQLRDQRRAADAATRPTTAPPARRDLAPARTRGRRRGAVKWALIVAGALALVVGGGWYWLSGGRYVETDDAYLQADVLNVATDVSGIVAEIPVKSGERVRAGQVLFRLDPLQFQLAVDQAKARLEQAGLDLESLKADYLRAQRAHAAQEAIVQNDQATAQRYQGLVAQHAVSQQQYDDARYKLKADQAQLGESEAQSKAALARLGGNADLPIAGLPAYKQAQAQLGEAERELRHTVVRAPYDGMVTRVTKLQIGQYLPAGTAGFGLVSTGDFWVAAEPKETTLTWARVGDPVTVTVDAFPGYTWHGTVQNIAPATDQEFSFLPAQNSSGNWVKVVQRVPVRITLSPLKDAPPLSAGMSVYVAIDTHHTRKLSDLF
jgi:membrane fusion protein (multidrug efflux system)